MKRRRKRKKLTRVVRQAFRRNFLVGLIVLLPFYITVRFLIFLIGYLPFFLVSFWVFDMETVRKKAITVGVIYSVDIIALVVFMGILKWI